MPFFVLGLGLSMLLTGCVLDSDKTHNIVIEKSRHETPEWAHQDTFETQKYTHIVVSIQTKTPSDGLVLQLAKKKMTDLFKNRSIVILEPLKKQTDIYQRLVHELPQYSAKKLMLQIKEAEDSKIAAVSAMDTLHEYTE